MIRPAVHPIGRISQFCLAVVVMTLVMRVHVMAGIALPPMPIASDTNAMEQYRIKVFYEAQKSEAAKLRVGKERYDKMLTNRAIMLQAMAAELAEREQQVNIPSQPAVGTYPDNQKSDTGRSTILGASVIGLGLIGFRYYLARLNIKDAASQNQ
jgi:hypothetical protein